MDRMMRSKHSNYIAAAIRYAIKESGEDLPDSAIIVTTILSDLSRLNEILGIDIYISHEIGSREYVMACKGHESFLKHFNEYQELY